MQLYVFRSCNVGVEWYIQSFIEGKEQFIPTADLMAIIKQYKFCRHQFGVDVEFNDGATTLIFDCLPKGVSSMLIARPVQSRELYEFLYSIMCCGNTIFFTTDCKFPIVCDQSVVNHLPEGMLRALGQHVVVNNVESFWRLRSLM